MIRVEGRVFETGGDYDEYEQPIHRVKLDSNSKAHPGASRPKHRADRIG